MSGRIDTPMTGEHFARFCEKMVGQPYWYGTCLYRCTQELARRKAAQYPAHYPDARSARYREDALEKRVCADCIGAAKGYAWTNGGIGVLESIGTGSDFESRYGSNGCPDRSANGMFAYAKSKNMPCGTIDTLPEIAGLALHKEGHTGYYIGGGRAVEWRGFKYGCVLSQVAGRGWKYWYQLPFLDYGGEMPETSETGEARTEKRTVEIVSKGGKVNIRRGNGTQYARISLEEPGSAFAYIATAENGWNAIAIGDQVGWVSGEYSRVR